MAKRTPKDIRFEIGFYEGVLRHSPDFIEALSVLGDLYTKAGLYRQGLAMDERLAALRPDDIVFYNLACSYALLGDIPRARQAMARAVEAGYCDFEYLQNDLDLSALLADAVFEKMLAEWRSRALPGRRSGARGRA